MANVIIRARSDLVAFVMDPAHAGLSKIDILHRLVPNLRAAKNTKAQKRHAIAVMLQNHSGNPNVTLDANISGEEMKRAGDEIATWANSSVTNPVSLSLTSDSPGTQLEYPMSAKPETGSAPVTNDDVLAVLNKIAGAITAGNERHAALEKKVEAATAPLNWGKVGVGLLKFFGLLMSTVPFSATTLFLFFWLSSPVPEEGAGNPVQFGWYVWVAVGLAIYGLSRLPKPFDDLSDFLLVVLLGVLVYVGIYGDAVRPLNGETVSHVWTSMNKWWRDFPIGQLLLTFFWSMVLLPQLYQYSRTVFVLPTKLIRLSIASVLGITGFVMLAGVVGLVWLGRDLATNGKGSFEGTSFGRFQRDTMGWVLSYLATENPSGWLVARCRDVFMPLPVPASEPPLNDGLPVEEATAA